VNETRGLPQTLIEAVRYFSDLDVCNEFVASLRWSDGPVCPSCGGSEHSYLKTRRLWKCKNKECHRQFSVKVGTIFEDSPLGLDKWLVSIWLIANSKNGISSHELHRAVGITQKSAWFVLQRIRLAMQTGSFNKITGEAEVDETFIGGAAKNMHEYRREFIKSGGVTNKTTVLGILERGGRVHAEVVADRTSQSLVPPIHERVELGSKVYTDKHRSYDGLRGDYSHETVDHAERYVDGKISTNGIENFWSLLKRGLHGTYVSVAPEHLFRYLDERVYTFNHRDQDDQGRFAGVVEQVTGRRLTYADLTGADA
jgi:transposase-like protein